MEADWLSFHSFEFPRHTSRNPCHSHAVLPALFILIKDRAYTSTDAFLADTGLIAHQKACSSHSQLNTIKLYLCKFPCVKVEMSKRRIIDNPLVLFDLI